MVLKNFLQKAAAVLLALIVWQAAAAIINEKILLVSPIQVVARLWKLCQEAEFWSAILYTLKRIATGFFWGLFTGILAAFIATRFKIVKTLLWPYMLFSRTKAKS